MEFGRGLATSFRPAEEGGDVVAVEVLASQGDDVVVAAAAEGVGFGVGGGGGYEDVGQEGAADLLRVEEGCGGGGGGVGEWG